ncbi:APC family permease, partial [Arthrobacter sp. Cr_A7]|uniref:APC family permease n=1 Tax=Arthrobacter sp. Cr_A7 TaxID=3031017 RepID=UPI0023DA353C
MSQEIQEANGPVATAPQGGRVGEEHRLRGNMGVPQLLFIVLAFNAPIACVAGVLPLVIGYAAGIGTPLLILCVAALMAIFAVGYTLMARKLPRAGAFYTFVTAGLGRPLGLATGFIAVITYTIGYLGVLPFVGVQAEQLFLGFGIIGAPWWMWAIVAAVIIGVLGYLRVDFSAKILGVVVVLELVAVLVYSAVVLGTGGGTGTLTAGSFNPTTIANGSALVGVLFLMGAFSGFEATAIFRDEVRDPVRTVPRATYLAVGTIGILYAFTSWVLIQSVGEEGVVELFAADPTTAFLGSVQQYLGIAAIGIAAYLLRTRPSEATVWHWAIAPIFSAVLLLVVAAVAAVNLDLLTGSPVLSSIAVIIPIVEIILGVGVALIVKAKNPQLYANIGTR